MMTIAWLSSAKPILITHLSPIGKKGGAGFKGVVYPVRKKVFPYVDEGKVIPVDWIYKSNLVLLTGFT